MASPLTICPDGAAGKDTYIGDTAATSNHDGENYLEVGDYSTGYSQAFRTLIAFDISGIPAGSTITAVTLSLWESSASNSGGGPASWDVEVRRLKRDWNEAQATWNIYSTGNNWGTAGCGHADDRVATVSAALTMDGTAAGAYVSWSGAGLVADVQAWLDGTATNYGWLISAPNAEFVGTTPRAANIFRPSDYATAGNRPKVVIEYTEAAAGCPRQASHHARARNS